MTHDDGSTNPYAHPEPDPLHDTAPLYPADPHVAGQPQQNPYWSQPQPPAPPTTQRPQSAPEHPAPHSNPYAPPSGNPAGYGPPPTGGQPNPYSAAMPPTTPPYTQPQFAPPHFAAHPMIPAHYGVDPFTGLAFSDKTRTTAGLLSLLLPFIGICGVGRLYIGHMGVGLTQLLLYWFGVLTAFFLIGFLIFPVVWVWAVIDGIILLSSTTVRDAQGRLLRR